MSRVRTVSEQVKSHWEETLDYFLLARRSQGLADRTVSDYKEHVTRFFKTTGADILDPAGLKLAVMRYFAESSKLSAYTFNTRRKLLKVFFSWAVEEGILLETPMKSIRKKKEDHQPRAVSQEDIIRLLELPDQKTYSGLRDYALLILTMDTGIRPREAAGLKLKDFNLPALQLTIPATVAKTRISRSLPISTVTMDAIRRLISARHPEWGEDVPVFATEDGMELTRFAWARRMWRYSRKLGVAIQPYALRHTFALIYLRQGGNSFALQRTMGHADLTMTKRYLALTATDLTEQHAIASPINNLVAKRQRVRKVK